MVTETKYNLFLDDIRYPETAFNYMKDLRYLQSEWIIVRNYDEFKCVIDNRGIPEIVSYDHDLAEEHYEPSTWSDDTVEYREKTGLDCAKYLIEVLDGEHHPDWIVHSWNPVGKKNIENLIQDYVSKKISK